MAQAQTKWWVRKPAPAAKAEKPAKVKADAKAEKPSDG